MKKILLVTLSVMLFSALFAGSASPAGAKEPKILEFDTMVGTTAGLTGAQSQIPLRGVNGGGLPWTLTSAHGELKTSGKLELNAARSAASTPASMNWSIKRAKSSSVIRWCGRPPPLRRSSMGWW